MRHDPPEYELIAATLMGHSRATRSGWNWDRTVELAAREEVLPTLRGRSTWPAEVTDFLDGIHELNAARNRQLLAEVEELALLLNQAGIEPVLLKGAAYLVAGVYSDPADRLLHDIDFLVAPDQSRRAFEIVEGQGYEPYVPNPTVFVLHHCPTLTRLHRVPVEIHHSLGRGACERILTTAEIVASSTRVRMGRAAVRLPSAEHLMTHLVVHSQLQHGSYYRIWPSLRMMLDLVVLNRRMTPDWGAIRERFVAHRKLALLQVHLLQIEKALGVPPPFPIAGGGVRRWYRRILWREPRLRFVDPIYTASRVVLPKLSLSWRLLRHPAGRKYVLGTLFRLSFYKRLLEDLAHG